jgi:tetratricopeptide (TPR) repeat protein
MRGYLNLSALYINKQEPDKALNYLDQALFHAQSTGEEFIIGMIYRNMGIAFKSKGDLIQAEAYVRQAETIFQSSSSPSELARVWSSLGLIYFHQGKWQEAQSLLEKALEVWRNTGNRFEEIEVLIDILDSELATGNLQQAIIRWKEVEQFIGTDHKKNTQYRHLKPRLEKYRRSIIGHVPH